MFAVGMYQNTNLPKKNSSCSQAEVHILEARHHTFYSHESELISQIKHVATFFYQQMPESKTE